jgi:transposase
MSKSKLVSDALWLIVEPLLPAAKPRRFRYPGRKPVANRVALSAIIYVLKTGVPWEEVPLELGCCGMTAWNRLQEWQEVGVWDKIHQAILDELEARGKLDRSHGAADSSSVRATGGGEDTGPNPTDRAKKGTKHHALTEAQGLPLAVEVTAANRNDITQLKPLVEDIPKVRNPQTQRRRQRRPKKLLADRAYDSQPHREWLEEQDIVPRLARRKTEHGSGLGQERWPIERLFAWLHDDRKIRVRDERRSPIHKALLTLAAALVCFCAL